MNNFWHNYAKPMFGQDSIEQVLRSRARGRLKMRKI